MNRYALIACGLVAACGGSSGAGGPADSSAADSSDAPFLDVSTKDDDAGVAPRDAGGGADSTMPLIDADSGEDATTVEDAGAPPEADAPDACAGELVPPSTLACTGLYADIATKMLTPGVLPYQPAIPLWSDGAQKARWIQLPPGTKIDATNPSEWTFPVGTKVWKEFSKNGKRIETRLFQKVDSGPPSIWRHATYAWNADESVALASQGGNIALDDDGGTWHIPTFTECEQCHNGRLDHILGFEQVSLGLAGAQWLTLADLVNQGLITPAPTQTSLTIGDDGTGAAAPALAWIHINCGVTCHNANSTATAYGLGMRLRLDPSLLDGRQVTAGAFDTLSTTMGILAVSPGWVAPVHWTRIVPGDPTDSLLVQLISNRGTNNVVGGQMPPIASLLVDTQDVASVVEWVSKMPSASPGDAGADAAVDSGDAASDSDAPIVDAATGD